jgi:urease accessory protein
MKRLLAATFAAGAMLAPDAAFAHPGLDHIHGVVSGFVHPFGGIDHVLAMVAIGVFAAQLGGRAIWLVPLAFVGAMAATGALAMVGYGIPYVETGIAVSVLAIGAAIAVRLHVPTLIAMAAAGLFAIFHGQAHGAEMPPSLSGLGYGLGFVAATALLHGIGIGGFTLIARPRSQAGSIAVRLIGAVAAFAGVMMLVRAA